MCIAIMKPESKIITEETLRTCWDKNDDGAGFMYAESGRLNIQKGFMDWPSFWSAWKDHQDKKAVLHFRIRTHGDTNADNTHPFQVGEGLAFVHNGMISNVDTKSDKRFSDTYHFNTKLLKKLYKSDHRFIHKDHYKDLIAGYIGYSKLIFLDERGKHEIINESKGEWEDGVWYSNSSYKQYKPPVRQSSPSGQIKPYVPQISGSYNSLTIGSRVLVKGHTTYSGEGFITYFGNGVSVGVKLDNHPTVVQMHSAFIYPAPAKSPQIEIGDVVKRKDSDTYGEVVGFLGQGAFVEFYDGVKNKLNTMVINIKDLVHWEDF
jgi:hypothetical protein